MFNIEQNNHIAKFKMNQNNCLDFTSHLQYPFKLNGFYNWFPNPASELQLMFNYFYSAFLSFVFANVSITLLVNLYFDFTDIFMGLEIVSDALPYIASVIVVGYFVAYKDSLYALDRYMNENFKYHSARGLTNMTMKKSAAMANFFAHSYTLSVFCSTTMYASLPLINYWRTDESLDIWYYVDVSGDYMIGLAYFRQFLAQSLMGLALGQLGVLFASNSIIMCGQLDLLCCSVRNARFTALLQDGVQYDALTSFLEDIENDERHNYLYSTSVAEDSLNHFDVKVKKSGRRKTFDIYDKSFDPSTLVALRDCARLCQVIFFYRQRLESFMSPLLALRVVQVTLYLCLLLYSGSRKFDMLVVEYIIAVAFDIFIYCYYGNQIVVQADRVSTALYQSSWQSMGPGPRRLLLNLLMANRRAGLVRAGGFLTMDLKTYVNIIKTSFSYYTLLNHVKEH